MKISVIKEADSIDRRIPLFPDHAGKLIKLGAEVVVESGLGSSINIADEEYIKEGAAVGQNRDELLKSADVVLRLRKPALAEVKLLKKSCVHISYLDPFNEAELVKAMAEAHVSAISMEMIPRTTLAQKMDALSSQANLAGYVAVILAAERLDKILPMMMTPAGTLTPARVFIIGAGVAGLQAIATAKRLGARVEAFDTRPVVAEQIQSLGAKFVKIDLGETGQTKDGYAKALTDEQLARQRQAMAKHCAQADIVITTAQLFGRRAPLIVTKEMIAGMKPGSIVVDLAVESGGNVEGSRVNEEVDSGGVKILGFANLPGRVPVHASRMYSSNIANFVEHFWNKDEKVFKLALDDEIMRGALVTHDGALFNEKLKKA